MIEPLHTPEQHMDGDTRAQIERAIGLLGEWSRALLLSVYKLGYIDGQIS